MKLHRLAWITTIVIGVQMILAGVIVGEDAGFVCPTWPLCSNGAIPFSGSLVFELVHRFVALLLGVLVIWLLAWVWRSYRHHRAMMWTCSLGLLSLLIQIIYAGLIVLFVFPGTATLVDVMNSMVMLSLFVHLANLAKRDYDLRQGKIVADPDLKSRSLKPYAWMVYLVGMLAVAAGAVFRHTGASQALFGEDSYILSHGRHVPPSHITSETLLVIHIFTAALLVAAGMVFLVTAYKKQRLTRAAVLTIALVLAQGVLGVAGLDTRLELIVVTLHWGTAGLIMGVIAFALSQTYLARNPVAQPSSGQLHAARSASRRRSVL